MGTLVNTTGSTFNQRWGIGRNWLPSANNYSGLQTSGTAIVKNLTITTSPIASSTFNRNLISTGSCTASSFVTSSDASIKTCVEDVDTEACMTMLKNIQAKTYLRTDINSIDKRIGFIAQDIQQWLPNEFANITAQVSESVLGLDYSRLTPVLWTIIKKLENRIT